MAGRQLLEGAGPAHGEGAAHVERLGGIRGPGAQGKAVHRPVGARGGGIADRAGGKGAILGADLEKVGTGHPGPAAARGAPFHDVAKAAADVEAVIVGRGVVDQGVDWPVRAVAGAARGHLDRVAQGEPGGSVGVPAGQVAHGEVAGAGELAADIEVARVVKGQRPDGPVGAVRQAGAQRVERRAVPAHDIVGIHAGGLAKATADVDIAVDRRDRHGVGKGGQVVAVGQGAAEPRPERVRLQLVQAGTAGNHLAHRVLARDLAMARTVGEVVLERKAGAPVAQRAVRPRRGGVHLRALAAGQGIKGRPAADQRAAGGDGLHRRDGGLRHRPIGGPGVQAGRARVHIDHRVGTVADHRAVAHGEGRALADVDGILGRVDQHAVHRRFGAAAHGRLAGAVLQHDAAGGVPHGQVDQADAIRRDLDGVGRRAVHKDGVGAHALHGQIVIVGARGHAKGGIGAGVHRDGVSAAIAGVHRQLDGGVAGGIAAAPAVVVHVAVVGAGGEEASAALGDGLAVADRRRGPAGEVLRRDIAGGEIGRVKAARLRRRLAGDEQQLGRAVRVEVGASGIGRVGRAAHAADGGEGLGRLAGLLADQRRHAARIGQQDVGAAVAVHVAGGGEKAAVAAKGVRGSAAAIDHDAARPVGVEPVGLAVAVHVAQGHHARRRVGGGGGGDGRRRAAGGVPAAQHDLPCGHGHPLAELVAVHVADADGAGGAAKGGGGLRGHVHRLGPGAADAPKEEVGRPARADQEVSVAIAVGVARRGEALDRRWGLEEDAIAALPAVQGDVAQRSGLAKDQEGARRGALADQEVGEVVAVGVARGSQDAAQPRAARAEVTRRAIRQHLQVGCNRPAARASIEDGYGAAVAIGAGEAHRQVGQAVGVEIAGPGRQHAAVVLTDAGEPQPDGAIAKGVHARAEIRRDRREREMPALVGDAGQVKGGVRLERGRDVGVGAAVHVAGGRHPVHYDLLADDVAGVAAAVIGAHLDLVLALRALAHSPVIGPVRAAGGHVAPGLAVDLELHPLDAGEVIGGRAPQLDRAISHGIVQGDGGRGVVHGDVDNAGRARVPHGVGGARLQGIDAVRRQRPGMGPGAERAREGLEAGRAALRDDAQLGAGHPGGPVGGRAADHIAGAAQVGAIGGRHDGHAGVIAVDDGIDALPQRRAAEGEGQGDVIARRRGADPRRDGGGDRLVDLERVGAGKGPGEAVAALDHGRGAVPRHGGGAHAIEPRGQVEREGRRHGLGGAVGELDGERDLLVGRPIGARAPAGDATDRRGGQVQHRYGAVRRVGAQAIGLFLRIVQVVAVGVVQLGVGGNPKGATAGDGDLPAALHGAAVIVAHLLAVGQPVAVGIGHVDQGADAQLQAVVQPVAVGIGQQRVGAVLGVGLPFVLVREPIAIGVPQARAGAQRGLLVVEQAVAVEVMIGERRPAPQALQRRGHHVQRHGVRGEQRRLLGEDHLLGVGGPAPGPVHAVFGPDVLIVEPSGHADHAVDLGGEGVAQPGGVAAIEFAADDVAVARVAHVLPPEHLGQVIIGVEPGELPLDIAVPEVIVVAVAGLFDGAAGRGGELERVPGHQPQGGVGEGGAELAELGLLQRGQGLGVIEQVQDRDGDGVRFVREKAGKQGEDHVDERQDGGDDLPDDGDAVEGKDDDQVDGGDDGLRQRHAPDHRIAQPAKGQRQGKTDPGHGDADDQADDLHPDRHVGEGLQGALDRLDRQVHQGLRLADDGQRVDDDIGDLERLLVTADGQLGPGVADGVDDAHDHGGAGGHGGEAHADAVPASAPRAHAGPFPDQRGGVVERPPHIGGAADGQGLDDLGAHAPIVHGGLDLGLQRRVQGAIGRQLGLVGQRLHQGLPIRRDRRVGRAGGPEVGGIGDEAHVADLQAGVEVAHGGVIDAFIALLDQLEHAGRRGHLPAAGVLLVHAHLDAAGGEQGDVGEVDAQLGEVDRAGAGARQVVQVADAQLLLIGDDDAGATDGRAVGAGAAIEPVIVVPVVQKAGHQVRAQASDAGVELVVLHRAAHGDRAARHAKGVDEIGGAAGGEARGDLLQRRLAGRLPLQLDVGLEGVVQPQQQAEEVEVVAIGRGAQDRRLVALVLGDFQAGDAEAVLVLVQRGAFRGDDPARRGVVLHLGHPDQLGIPLDVGGLPGGVGHLAVKAVHGAAVLRRHQGDQHDDLPVAIHPGAEPVLVRQALLRRHVGLDQQEGGQAQVLGRVIQVLDVPFRIPRPVQRRGRIAQVAHVLGLRLDLDELVAAKVAARGAQLGRGGVACHGKGRDVLLVRHAVAVVVIVPQVGDAVAVEVRRGRLPARRLRAGPL